jgi:hypothetical protein
MKNYVRRIFEDYGLITCGWLAVWDKGLIDIINASSLSRYNSFFTDIGEANDIMKTLSTYRHGEIMLINSADDLFTELYEQIAALEQSNTSRNMNHDMMMARVKKYLSSERHNIEYSDLIEKLGTEAYDKIMAKANYNFTITPEQFSAYFELHHNVLKSLMDAAILAARWGKAYHIEIFGDLMVKLCTKPFINGESYQENTQYLHALGATLLLNTIGVACVKYERFAELNRILKLSVPAGNFMGFHRLSLLYLLWFDTLKNEWPPIKQGMFGGSYDEYKKVSNQAEEYYKQTMKY